MKIRLFIIQIFIVFCIFTGCGEKTYSFQKTVDEIQSIAIVSAKSSLDFTVIKELSQTEQKVFLEKFKTIEFQNYYIGDPMSLSGDAIKITYQNGDYEMICYYWSEYVKNGEVYFVPKNCDEDTFNDLLENFSN